MYHCKIAIDVWKVVRCWQISERSHLHRKTLQHLQNWRHNNRLLVRQKGRRIEGQFFRGAMETGFGVLILFDALYERWNPWQNCGPASPITSRQQQTRTRVSLKTTLHVNRKMLFYSISCNFYRPDVVLTVTSLSASHVQSEMFRENRRLQSSVLRAISKQLQQIFTTKSTQRFAKIILPFVVHI